MLDRTLKDKLISKKMLCGTHTGLNNTVLTEIMAGLGYDYIWIDTEHAPVDYAELLQMVANCWNAGTPPVVRVNMHDRNHVKRVLEMGPAGIIFPMIDTPEEADEAMKYTLYPPDGVRGFGPQRAIRYGLDDDLEYLKNANPVLCRFIQIETPKGIENLPELVRNPWIDGFIIGPCDLSCTAGVPGDVYGEKVTALIKKAASIIKPTGKRFGLSIGSTDLKVAQHWRSLGIDMLSTGCDYSYVLCGARENLKTLRSLEDFQE